MAWGHLLKLSCTQERLKLRSKKVLVVYKLFRNIFSKKNERKYFILRFYTGFRFYEIRAYILSGLHLQSASQLKAGERIKHLHFFSLLFPNYLERGLCLGSKRAGNIFEIKYFPFSRILENEVAKRGRGWFKRRRRRKKNICKKGAPSEVFLVSSK